MVNSYYDVILNQYRDQIIHYYVLSEERTKEIDQKIIELAQTNKTKEENDVVLLYVDQVLSVLSKQHIIKHPVVQAFVHNPKKNDLFLKVILNLDYNQNQLKKMIFRNSKRKEEDLCLSYMKTNPLGNKCSMDCPEFFSFLYYEDGNRKEIDQLLEDERMLLDVSTFYHQTYQNGSKKTKNSKHTFPFSTRSRYEQLINEIKNFYDQILFYTILYTDIEDILQQLSYGSGIQLRDSILRLKKQKLEELQTYGIMMNIKNCFHILKVSKILLQRYPLTTMEKSLKKIS